MAIIICPECGRQISDKAPVCPNCGVEIGDKITRCKQCGEIYFKSEKKCPKCHNNNSVPSTANNNNNKKKNNNKALILSIIIALIIIGVGAYMYNNAKGEKEAEEYEYALKSNDPVILQAYLDNFKDAPQEHIDSVNACLVRLNRHETEWSNALMSKTKSALFDFINDFPDSRHKQEALNIIDSIDWVQSVKNNTLESYQTYINLHSDGNYYEDAVAALKKIKAVEVSTDENGLIRGILHNFFVSINTRNENGLTSAVSETLNLLGKVGANKNDVITFMNKLYKADVKNMLWSMPSSCDITKKEIGDEMYEYSVVFMATQLVNKTDGSSTTNLFKIKAKINPEGKITDLSMTKIVNE